jgi:hypothetical protein
MIKSNKNLSRGKRKSIKSKEIRNSIEILALLRGQPAHQFSIRSRRRRRRGGEGI